MSLCAVLGTIIASSGPLMALLIIDKTLQALWYFGVLWGKELGQGGGSNNYMISTFSGN